MELPSTFTLFERVAAGLSNDWLLPALQMISAPSSPSDSTKNSFIFTQVNKSLDDIVRLDCPYPDCLSVFTRKRKFVKSNLSRHLKFEHGPVEEQLTCDFEGCGVVIKARYDDYMNHRGGA